MKSKLTEKQKQTLKVPADLVDELGIDTVQIRYDDQCGNGHNTFAITAWSKNMGGCCHDEVVKAFPHLKPFIKWHLTSSDGPLHYIANTVYHASDRDCWGGRKGEVKSYKFGLKGKDGKPVVNSDGDEVAWRGEDEAQTIAAQMGAEIVQIPWQIHEGKERELTHARSSAVWPDATDEQLSAPKRELTKMLKDRLPALMDEFKQDMESLGFTY